MKQIYITSRDKIYMIVLGILLLAGMTGCAVSNGVSVSQSEEQTKAEAAWQGAAYAVLNENIPSFTEEEKKNTEPFERYSELDVLGRCGTAYANICVELMPEEEREGIGQIKPSGWHTVKYENVDGKYLYNRCHLIGYQLAGENANERNLITGTRYLNTEGMLPFENQVADYVRATGNHVLYRVTPVYEGDNLVADGVEMEAFSVEDEGEGICYHVFVYNCQPGIVIDYATGESALAEADNGTDPTGASLTGVESENNPDSAYILNTNTKKFHLPSCSSVSDIKAKNKEEVAESRENLILKGYEPCRKCNP